MLQAWRWYGPDDPVTLDDVRQAGATDIVTALHGFLPGETWTRDAVRTRKALIEDTPADRVSLRWSVVESIPVPDDVKRLGADAKASIASWIASLEAVAAEGLRIVCYNFMPVLDWTRTDLDWPRPTGATALRFDQTRYAAFDAFVLKREGAAADYTAAVLRDAEALAARMTPDEIADLTRTIAAGLPGTTSDSLDLDGLRAKLDSYRGIDAARLRANLVAFLERVAPVAEKLGVQPDAPPRRPAAAALRAAAHRLDGGGLPGAVRRRPVARQRHVLLHRIARRLGRERPRGHRARLRGPHPLRPSEVDADANPMAPSSKPTTSTAMSTWWRSSANSWPRRAVGRTAARSRSAPTTATRCSTTASSAPTPAIRPSAG